MSDWRSELQPASFRGVPFEVLTDSVPVGRRVQVHEFVQRDKPYAEDLGRVTRPFSVTAFVGGDDCISKRDALINAIDTPGEGELILPAWGAVTVVCTQAKISHAREEGGLVRFDLEFVESGDGESPTAEVATGSQLSDAIDTLQDSVGGWFEKALGQIPLSRINLDILSSSLAPSFNALQSLVGGALNLPHTLRNVDALASMLIGSPLGFLNSVRSIVRSVRSALKSNTADSALSTAVRSANVAASIPAAAAVGGKDAVAVVRAAQDLMRHAHLAVGMEAAAQLPVIRKAQPMDAVPHVWQQMQQPLQRPEMLYLPDVLTARDLLDNALWLVQRSETGRPPADVFVALQDARACARRHMAQAASVAVPMVMIEPPAVLPALVLAYRQWGDATRDEEIVQRNRVVHPGFVPQRKLQVARD